MILAIVLLLAAADADGGVPPDADSQLEQELQKAIQSDEAAAGKRVPQAQASPEPVPAAASAGNTPTLLRGSQSLNPDISAILDADFGWQRRPMSLLNGDDPNLHPEPRLRAVGPAVQEVELAFTAIVDPYFKGEVYLTIPNLPGIHVEEAFAPTTPLPWNLPPKTGRLPTALPPPHRHH